MKEQIKKAVGYVRCSTEMQTDSPEQQKSAILEFAKAQGYAIIELFIDFGKSGTTFDQRSEFQRLWGEVQNNPKFSAVIAYDESRWGRAIDAEENAYWRVQFRKKGVQVLLVKTSIDPKNENAPIMKALEGVEASKYSKKLSELTLRGELANGKYSNGGTAPFGYTRIAVNQTKGTTRILADGDWCIRSQEKVLWGLGDPEEIKVVREIFQRKNEGVSEILIAKELNDKNIPCARRGRWRNKDQKWSSGTIRSIIENPAYYGNRVFNRNSMSSIIADRENRQVFGVKYPHYKNDPRDWKEYPNAHEPIVTKEEWERANIRKRPGRKGPRERSTIKYELRGMIHCSICGFPFQGMSMKVKNKQYDRYVCGGYQSKRLCEFCALPKQALEEHVETLMKEVLQTKNIRKATKQIATAMLKERPERHEARKSVLNKRVLEIEGEEKNLIKSISKGTNPDLVNDRINELQEERRLIDAQLIEIGKDQSAISTVADIEVEIQRIVDVAGKDVSLLSPTEKHLLFKKFVRGIEVDRKANKVICTMRRIPAVHLIIAELEQEGDKKTTAHEENGQLLVSGVAGTGLEPVTFGL